MQLTCPHCSQVLQFSGKRPAFCAYCGKSLPSPDEASTVAFDGAGLLDDETPSEVGGYRLLRLLGTGGMGRVYEAEEAASGRRVALKLIAAEFAASSAAVERFRREGRLASCVAHPRCVFVLAAEEADGRPYIVMELMPGATLQDVVNRDGPLPVEQALSKILDVIDGLREAHRLGVIHRDVKPSNCFLETDGRVKIGDFGLSKSLVGGDALTRTGTFLGTPLFASPEQIKSETVGPQSDVYSVAATLYCLLTGRAPFQGGDPAATLARIVSEAAPPMRSLRPDLPAALDKVVLRGLERDRAKRWQDLDEFRTALLPFVPGRLSIGGLGVRFGAFLIDNAVLMVPGFAAGWLIVALTGGGSPWNPQMPQMRVDRQLFQLLVGLLLWGLYFGGCEALWGCTPGKRLLGLRVCKAKGGERPGVVSVALRTGLFYLLLNLGTFAVAVLLLSGAVDPSNPAPEQQIRLGLLLTAAFYPLWALGIVLILCTMRARNGYRGMHEVLSGTRVVLLPCLERDRAKRWRDLDEFRTALLPFVPGRLSIGGLGIRFGAFLIDNAVLMVPGFAAGWLIVALTGGGSPWNPQMPQMRVDRQLFQLLVGLLLWALYFGGCESLWGCTPGKRLLGLRVCKAKGGERPSVAAVALRTGLFCLLMNLGTFAVAVLLLSGAVDPSNPAPEQQMRLGLLLAATFYPLWALGIVLILCTMRARNGYRGLHEVLSGTRVVLLPYAVRGRTLRGRDLKLETSPPEGLPGRIGPFDILGVLPSVGRGRLLLGHDASLGRSAWIWLRPADDPPLSPARRELSRTTRLRWLAGGREGEFQWDAFLAPEGGVVMTAASAAGRLSWGETRRLLNQLADELAEAEADGTMPATLTTGQIWVRPDGLVHLLDVAVSAEPADAPAGSPSQGLSLLARTAVLALEGQHRPANERPAGVRAPIPRHASVLGRLLGVGAPYMNVQEFRAALAASAEKPVETTRQRRLAHLAVLTAFLSVGLCAGLSPVALSPPLATVGASFRIRQMEGLRERLAEVAAQDAVPLEKADPANRQIALRHSGEDARLDEALGRTLERTRRDRQARLDAMSWLGRGYAEALEKQVQDPQDAQGRPLQLLPPASTPDTVRSMAEMYATANDGEKNRTIILPWMQTIMLLFWPVVWVMWAFLTRGGLTFLLMGLSLVRGNGRPALRVQCAWRALLVWAPVTGLAVASVWLSASYWSHWPGDGSDGWMLWASSAAWWASLALLPLYVALALVFPRRSLHDWLAGTYLVPR